MTSASTGAAGSLTTPRRRTALRVVGPRPVACIYEGWAAEIAARDWDRVMVEGDRRAPVDLPDRPRRFFLDALSLKGRRG